MQDMISGATTGLWHTALLDATPPHGTLKDKGKFVKPQRPPRRPALPGTDGRTARRSVSFERRGSQYHIRVPSLPCVVDEHGGQSRRLDRFSSSAE